MGVALTRVYRDGAPETGGFPVDEVSKIRASVGFSYVFRRQDCL